MKTDTKPSIILQYDELSRIRLSLHKDHYFMRMMLDEMKCEYIILDWGVVNEMVYILHFENKEKHAHFVLRYL